MSHLALSFLDTFQVLKAQQPITHFRSNNVRCLLVFLAMQADRPFAREVLATLFWPDEADSVASKNLRQILYRLRKAVGETDARGEPLLLVTRQMVQFNPNCEFSLDVQQFLQAVHKGNLEAAVAVYKGDLLPGFTADSIAFEEWLRQERESLHQLAMETFSALGDQHVQNGRLEQAQAVIRKQLTLEPWRESAHRQLMRILARMGDRGGALAQYELCRQQLQEELGIEPMAETVTLLEEIKAGRYGRTEAKPTSTSFRPLHNLPEQLTPLIGREAELQHLSALLLDEQKRLITLAGVGGMGKTRLALAFAHQPGYYDSPQHGVTFVPLTPLNDAGQIISAEIERSADFLETDMRNIPARHRSMRAVFEASWQRLTAEEQAVFTQLTIFQGGFTRSAAQNVTGASLRLLGRLVNKSLVHYDHNRQRYQIHELLRQYGAEQLALDVERETAVLQQHSRYFFTFLAQQTARLKSQAQQVALADIELELGNIRTAWRWAIRHKMADLLSQAADALRLFYQWKGQYQPSSEAAEELIAAFASPGTHAEQRLVAKGLFWQAHVCHVKGEFWVAQTLLKRSDALLDNIASAGVDVRPERIDWLLLTGQLVSNTDYKQAETFYMQAYEQAVSLADEWYQARSLRYWGMTVYSLGQYETAETHLQQAFALAQQTGDGRLQARILDELGQLTAQLAHLEQAEAYVRQSYAIYQSFGDPLNKALGAGKLGIILMFAGKLAEGERLLSQSLTLFQELGDENMLAQSHIRLGVAQTYLGKLAAGQNSMQQGLKLYRQLGNRSFIGWALWGVGESYLALGEFEAALDTFTESIDLLKAAGRLDMASWSLSLRGLAASFLEQDTEARAFLKQGLQSGSDMREYLAVVTALAGVMLLYARTGKVERAAELYALLRCYPFGALSNQGWTARLHERMGPLLAHVPAEVVQAAEANGRKLDLWQTAETLLDELTSEVS